MTTSINSKVAPSSISRLPYAGLIFSVFSITCALVGCTDNASLGDEAVAAGGDSGASSSGAPNATAGSAGKGAGGTGNDAGAPGIGSAGTDAGDNQTCAAPSGDKCTGGLLPYQGREVDTVNHCLKKAILLSCSLGANDETSCWVDAGTGDMFVLAASPCMPSSNWRACTSDESDGVSGISKDCASN